jgi:hypothetical protein
MGAERRQQGGWERKVEQIQEGSMGRVEKRRGTTL